MEFTLKGTPEEIAKMLQAIGSGKEHCLKIDPKKLSQDLSSAIDDIRSKD